MDPSEFRRLMDIVGDALELPAADREAFVREHCSGEMLEEALSLLADQPSQSRLTRLIEERVARHAVAVSGIDGGDPERIDTYRILERIGAGGMGLVYRAMDEGPLAREVAIKLVREGLDNEAILLRFEAERQVLARMDHPNIAAIHAAGSDLRGRPYFVMELVEGSPLVEYCDQRELSLEERLRLFATICDAVQHAHHRGVIHRDLKPSNILVTEVGGRPFPKIIDFGIAKLADIDPGMTSALTSAGMLVGTLEYMSPEQARSAPGEVDARSDIYALGVLLYELISGTLPFEASELRGGGLSRALEVIQEQTPIHPSRRVQTAEADSAVVARQRATSPRSLSRKLKGELDWITGRALEKQPSDRYQSAKELGDDIRRYLNHEPVHAGPPSQIYRLRRLARRHRAAAVAAVSITLALFLGSVLAGIGLVRATAARKVAEEEAQKVQVINEFLTDMLASVQPEKALGREVTVREVVDEAATRLEDDATFASAPLVEAALQYTIGDTYQALGDFDTALTHLRRARALYEEQVDVEDERYFDTLDRIGMVHWLAGDLHSSLEISKTLLEIRRRTHGENHVEYGNILGNVANTHADMGDLAKAEELHREAVAIDREAYAEAPGDFLCFSVNNLATVLADQEKWGEAIELHRESLALRTEHMGAESPAVAISLMNLGFALRGAGQLDEAGEILRRAVDRCETVFGRDHLRTAVALSNLAGVSKDHGQLEQAEREARDSMERMASGLGPDSWRVAHVQSFLGSVLLDMGRLTQAHREASAAWELLSAQLGEGHVRARAAAGNLARIARAQGDLESASEWESRAGKEDH